ncbi:MAG: LptE family protein [Bacteroidales bacterium]|nr:LptE family protein [Bacteroidales bacterium]
MMSRSGILLVLPLLILAGCTVNYSFSGASIDPKMKTYSVQYFANRAPIVVPTLSQQLTEALREKIRSQTKLRLVTGVGDADFSGEITRYETRAVAITGNDRPAQNRLTIDVRVRYTNSVNPKESFESTFSRYKDYDANQSLAAVEQDLIKDILDLLTEDIFNKAFVNW